MKVKCRHCDDYFEVADPAQPSRAEPTKKKVNCYECGQDNEIMWPADPHPIPRKYQES